MNVTNGLQAIKAYGGSKRQEEALIARTVEDKDKQIRIAQNSDQRLVLLNLALNPNLEQEAVQELFSRDLDYLTTRLESLGYKKEGFFSGLF